MDPSTNLTFPRASRAACRSLVSSAAATTSSPQQPFACFRRLLVDFASPVSRYRRTMRPFPLPLQCFALHSKTWTQRPLIISIDGVRLKNTYIGEFHSFKSRSICVLGSDTDHRLRDSHKNYPALLQQFLRRRLRHRNHWTRSTLEGSHHQPRCRCHPTLEAQGSEKVWMSEY
jgi:hypothetical protein